MLASIEMHMMRPMVEALAYKGTPFVGVLCAGLIVGNDEMQVLKWKAQFGDPETQSLMPLLASDLIDHIEACVDGVVADVQVQWHRMSAATVVLAAAGYPGEAKMGSQIFGIKDAERLKNIFIFQGGTTFDGMQSKTGGGRVLSVTAVGSPLRFAVETAYGAAGKIQYDGMQYRRDIGAAYLQ